MIGCIQLTAMSLHYSEENVDYKIEGNNIVTLCKDENSNPVRFASTSTFVLMPSIASWHLDGIPGIRDTTATDWDLKWTQY